MTFSHYLPGFLLTAMVWSSAQAEPVRPNIVFAFADDWGRHASAYARVDGAGTVNDLLRTPNFDRVASEGVLFGKVFRDPTSGWSAGGLPAHRRPNP